MAYMGSHINITKITSHNEMAKGHPTKGNPAESWSLAPVSVYKYQLSAFSAVPHVGTLGGRGKLCDQPPHPIGVNKATHRSCNQFSI